MARRLNVVGNSLTKDNGIDNWVRRMERRSRQVGRDAFPVSIVNGGYNGLTTAMLVQPDDVYWDYCVSQISELMLFFLGTNDHYIKIPGDPGPDGQPIVPLEQYEDNMVSILTRAKNINTGLVFNGGRPLVGCMSPPYVQDKDGASHVRMALYVEANRRAAKQADVAWVNVYEAMSAACNDDQAIFKATYLDDPENDGVHCNDRAHDIIEAVAAVPLVYRLLYEGQ
jgi:lysophospholipase L1-like esterase